MQKKLWLSGSLCLPCGRDLRVCEARLQASPRGVVTIPHRLRRSSLSHKRGLIKINPRLCRTFSLRSSLFSPLFYLKKIPAGAGIFIAFILPNKRQIRRQSERQRRLQSPMRRYRRARGECLSGRRPRRTCPWAYVREFSRFSESASRRRS